MTAVIETRALSRWFASVVAVNDITTTLGTGVHAILGPNGAGKSTLLKMLTGQLLPSRGTVRVFGQELCADHRVFSRIGICHERDDFWEDMSGLEFVTVLARAHGYAGPEARSRARQSLERLGMAHAMRRPIRTYSKGMRQRTKLAQAVVHDPELLFFDEPMTGLDPPGRRDVVDLVCELADGGATVLLSTHILHEAESMTNRILLMAWGRILAEGDVHEIRQSLRDHPYRVKVACDQPRRLARAMLDLDGVSGAEVADEHTPDRHVVVRTRDADEVYDALAQAAVDGARIHEISSPDDNIESVFEYLVRRGARGT